MKRLLVHLLMLVMLMPGLACGPFMSAGKAHAAMAHVKDMPGCHGMKMDQNAGGKKTPDHNGLMLFKDCAKADLYGADHASLEKPDAGKVFYVAWTDIVPAHTFTPADFQVIRGPPPDSSSLPQTRPSILLITQRFRE